ncbi:MAG: Xaa-Pro peptidase family protein [Mailhella sp.]|nr:Xaa-Pro peptidase family protein [Mailhella sp.]
MDEERIPFGGFAERIPAEELALRHARMRAMLARFAPEADGFLLLGDTDIYYASGTMAAAALWLPASGEPVLFVRKGFERARAESALGSVLPFRSSRELDGLARGAGSPLGACLAADMASAPCEAATRLSADTPGVRFVSGDAAMSRARAVKTPWEVVKMRRAGAIHARCAGMIPEVIRPGMTEFEVWRAVRDLFAAHGDGGHVCLRSPGRVSAGTVSAGDGGLYPMAFDGPLGTRGIHPTAPFGGSREREWREGQVLAVDVPVGFEGYVSDRTATFFAGSRPPADITAACGCCTAVMDAAAERMRAGVRPSEIWELSCAMAAEAGYGSVFMGVGPERVRFLGHGIGLEVNEWPAVASRFDEPLEAGMTIALEPKIALPGIGMVGVETTFLVGSGPAEPLNGPWEPCTCIA